MTDTNSASGLPRRAALCAAAALIASPLRAQPAVDLTR